MNLKWLQKFLREPKLNLEELKIPTVAERYMVKTENRFSVLEDDWEEQ